MSDEQMQPGESRPPSADSIAAAVTWLEDWRLFRVRGEDARDFLSRQLTCDLEPLSPQCGVHGAWLSAKGRVLALVRLLVHGGDIVLATDAAAADDAMRKLAMYVLRSDVQIEPAHDLAAVGVAYPAGPPPLDLPTVERRGQSQRWHMLTAVCVDLNPTRLALVGDRDALTARRRSLLEGGLTDAPLPFWHRLDCEAGQPHIAEPTVDTFVPQMLNLDLSGGVSFSKGCYPGQEIVARTQHLGRIKRRMYVLRIPACDAPPAAGAAVVRSDSTSGAAGRVVLGTALGDGAAIALAVLPIDEVADGARYRVDGAEITEINEPGDGFAPAGA